MMATVLKNKFEQNILTGYSPEHFALFVAKQYTSFERDRVLKEPDNYWVCEEKRFEQWLQNEVRKFSSYNFKKWGRGVYIHLLAL